MLATSEAMALAAANVQPVIVGSPASTCFAPVHLQIANGSPQSVSDYVREFGLAGPRRSTAPSLVKLS
jgi:hypothetical protein